MGLDGTGIGAEAAGRGLDEDWDYSPLAGARTGLGLGLEV
jgi:hypothetical protein